jgi:SNF2 family DNA or RNA helicase
MEGEKFGVGCKVSRDGKPAGDITITNYERLHLFDRNDYTGVVCDESSILKNIKGATKNQVIEFIKKMPYRLCMTATPAPNDPIELGTTSEAVGDMGAMDMLGTFFKNNEKSLHPAFIDSKWTFKPHSETAFWKWVSTWARAVRKPSDMGFEDNGFVLPEMTVNDIVIDRSQPLPGMLFSVPAVGMWEERQERKVTVNQRCEKVAELVEGHDTSVIWGSMNIETDTLEKMIPDAVNIKGGESLDEREEKLLAFSSGQIKRLITKPKIGAFGLNWQHCAHMTFFPDHSYEQFYQGTRRIWRFGQKRNVTVDVVMSEAQERVFNNLSRKSEAADKMFEMLVQHMNDAQKVKSEIQYTNSVNLPSWLTSK